MSPQARERLDSWKEIAAYLGRDLRTVRRWEKDKGLPVHRVPGGERQAVFAYRAEIDAWLLKDVSLRIETPRPDAASLTNGVSNGVAVNLLPEGAANRPAAAGTNAFEFVPVTTLEVESLAEPPTEGTISSPSWPSRWWWKPIFTLRRISLAALLLAILAGLLLINAGILGHQIDKVAFSGNSVQARSPKGDLLWTYSFGQPLVESETDNPARIWIDDPGKSAEALVLVVPPFHVDNQDVHASEALFALSTSGRLTWRHDFNDTIRFGGNSYGPPWQFGASLVTLNAGHSSIWSAVNSFLWSFSILEQFDKDGRELSKFVNWGHIHVLNQFHSRVGSFILAGGINNDCNCAMLAVLKEDQPSGSSPSLGNSGSICDDCPAGQPYRYLLFPRSELADATDFTYNNVVVIQLGKNEIQVGVKETKAGEGLGPDWEMYKLSEDFLPQTYAISDHMPILHRQLEAQGKIYHTVSQCPELNGEKSVRLWSPEHGWTIVTVAYRK